MIQAGPPQPSRRLDKNQTTRQSPLPQLSRTIDYAFGHIYRRRVRTVPATECSQTSGNSESVYLHLTEGLARFRHTLHTELPRGLMGSLGLLGFDRCQDLPVLGLRFLVIE